MSTDTRGLFDIGEFLLPDGAVHLSVGGEAPYLKCHATAHKRYVADKSDGQRGRQRMDREVERVRERVAAQLGVAASDIALLSNVADAINVMAPHLLHSDSGNICLFKHDFPSLVLPLLREATKRGVEVRWLVNEKELEDALDMDTRLVATSHVCYRTAKRFDIARMRELCDRYNARLVVDYSQSTGCIPSDWSLHDIGVSAVYKWLLAETGVALLHVNGERQGALKSMPAGWRAIDPPHSISGSFDDITTFNTARRHERGNLALSSIYTLGSATDFLQRYRIEAIWNHISALVEAVGSEAHGLELPVQSPLDADRRCASLCIATNDASKMATRLSQEGIMAWAGAGRIRFSFHAYNTTSDAERLIEFLGSGRWI